MTAGLLEVKKNQPSGLIALCASCSIMELAVMEASSCLLCSRPSCTLLGLLAMESIPLNCVLEVVSDLIIKLIPTAQMLH